MMNFQWYWLVWQLKVHFERVYVSIFSKFNVTVGRHTMTRNSCITVPAEGKKLLIDEISEHVWPANCFQTSWRKIFVNFRVSQNWLNYSAALVSEAVIEVRRAGIGGVTVWMLSRTKGVGVGGCGACVGCAPWSALASSGKLWSDIVMKDLVNFGSIK